MKKLSLSLCLLVVVVVALPLPVYAQADCKPGAGSVPAGTPNVIVGIGNILFGILSSFSNAFFPGTCQKPTDSMKLFEFKDDDNLRHLGNVINCDVNDTVATVKYDARLGTSIPYEGYEDEFPDIFTKATSHRVTLFNSDIWNFGASTATLEEQRRHLEYTLDFYWNGKRNRREFTAALIDNIKRGAAADDDLAYKVTGPVSKLYPSQCKSVTGEWERCFEALRHEVEEKVGIGWACELVPDFPCNERLAAYDSGIAYVYDPATLGAQSDRGEVLAEEDSGTKVIAVEAVDTTRPLMISEIFCADKDFSTPRLSRSAINQVCAFLYGPDYVDQGIIASGSFMHGIFQKIYGGAAAKLPRPKNNELFGVGKAYYYVPEFINSDDEKIEAKLTLDKGPNDPEPNPIRKERAALPWIQSTAESAKKLTCILSPSGCNIPEYSPPEEQCADGTTGNIADKIGSANHTEPFNLGEMVNPGNTQGVYDVRGQVLQAYTAPTPQPSPDYIEGDVPAERKLVIEVEVTQNMADTVRYSSGDQSFSRLFMPKEVSDQMRTPIGGVPPEAWPQRGLLECEGDAQCDDGKVPLPLLGGALVANHPQIGITTNFLIGLRDKKDQANYGKWLKDITSGKIKPSTRTPWDELASFQVGIKDNTANLSKN